MRRISDAEFAAVTSLQGEMRYQYFVRQVADWEVVWTLKAEDDYILAGDDNGRECVPVWPHSRFAEACVNLWPGAEPAQIDLDDWLAKWTPGMQRDGRLVAVFPVPGSHGVVVPPERLLEDLNAELSQYE